MDLTAFQGQLEAVLDKWTVPELTREALVAYIMTGRPTGSFLHAVLTNDLFQAVSRADDANRRTLANLVIAIHLCAPLGCVGSEEKVQTWRSHRGMEKFSGLSGS